MPNAWLDLYFKSKGMFVDLDFSAMKETKPDALFDAWLELSDSQRKHLDAELLEIFEMCNAKGFQAIIDEMHWQFRNYPEEIVAYVELLSSLPNHFERAMFTFLSFTMCWPGAVRFHHADVLTYWRKRNHLPNKPAAVDEDSLKQLAMEIANYYHTIEGRGKNCVVEPFRRGELDYFFAYPEDYSQRSIEWVDGDFNHRPHNPALEVVFVYSQKEGSLDLNFRGSKKPLEILQGMFCTTILKLKELPPDPKDVRVYNLNPLRSKSFNFVYRMSSRIQSVTVKKLRLSSRHKKGDRITVEADTNDDSKAIYALLEKLGKSIPLHQFNVSQVELIAILQSDPEKPTKSITIRISHPNSCSLKYDEVDLQLRKMLADSGIEPKPESEIAIPWDSD